MSTAATKSTLTRQQLLDRLLSLRDADEDMNLPVLVMVSDGPRPSEITRVDPVFGEITDCAPGKILFHTGTCALLTARRVP